MDTRPLGNSGLQISRLGLGCVTFGREIDERTSFQLMDYAVAQGVNLFDTAEAYGQGESERIIGRWLHARGCRDQIILQTKVKPNFTRMHVRESLEKSLARLGVDSVDIYLLHEFDPATPLEETMDAMTAAVDCGLVRVAGCSNFTVEQLRASENMSRENGFTRFEVVQPVYSLLAREIESGLLPYCKQNGIGVVSYSPLAAGFLTGKYTHNLNAIPQGSRFDVIPGHRDFYFRPKNFAIVEQLRGLGARTGISMSRLALGWTLRNPDLNSILVGGRTISHIETAIAALQISLDPGLVEEMDQWSTPSQTSDSQHH